jgi:ubiquitin-conjugating enzyme E2 D/E
LSLAGEEVCTLELASLEARVFELKMLLEQRTGFPRATQELVCCGEVFQDTWRICRHLERISGWQCDGDTGASIAFGPRRQLLLYLIRREQAAGLARLSRATQRRLCKELRECHREGGLPEGCALGPVGGDLETSPLRWAASIEGPDGSPYEGGVFRLDITVPCDYPFQPPSVSFATQVFHPLVAPGGTVEADILNEQWCPAFSLPSIVRAVRAFLERPHHALESGGGGCGNFEAARLSGGDRRAFDQCAQRWTLEHAVPCISH